MATAEATEAPEATEAAEEATNGYTKCEQPVIASASYALVPGKRGLWWTAAR